MSEVKAPKPSKPPATEGILSAMGILRQFTAFRTMGRIYSILMDRQYATLKFTTRLIHDNKEGNSALELHATRKDGGTKRVARVVFWDAYGDFFFETFGSDIPVIVAERLISEAKATIKVR